MNEHCWRNEGPWCSWSYHICAQEETHDASKSRCSISSYGNVEKKPFEHVYEQVCVRLLQVAKMLPGWQNDDQWVRSTPQNVKVKERRNRVSVMRSVHYSLSEHTDPNIQSLTIGSFQNQHYSKEIFTWCLQTQTSVVVLPPSKVSNPTDNNVLNFGWTLYTRVYILLTKILCVWTIMTFSNKIIRVGASRNWLLGYWQIYFEKKSVGPNFFRSVGFLFVLFLFCSVLNCVLRYGKWSQGWKCDWFFRWV